MLFFLSGYETDERGSLGNTYDRCRWQIKVICVGAAVEKIEEQRKPDNFFVNCKPARSDNPEVGVLPILSLFFHHTSISPIGWKTETKDMSV